MGLFGALTTAVTGMRAQSFALENVSGNIANSQTIAYKRIDTSFQDLIPDDIPSRQKAGAVIATSRATNNVQGDVQNATVGTFMAINGEGFFVVAKPTSFVDGRPVFSGTNNYTRRGDFQPDKNGYLVNGAGYYLLGIAVDPTTGNLAGSVPELLRFQNDFLPAQPTTQVDYRVNLARYPLTQSQDSSVVGSELLNPIGYAADPRAIPPQSARIMGSGASLLSDAVAVLTGTGTLPTAAPGLVNGGTFTINGQSITLAAGDLATSAAPQGIIEKINAVSGTTGVTASIVGGQLVLTGDTPDRQIELNHNGSATSLFTELGIDIGTTNPTNLLTQAAVAQGQTMDITVGGNTINIVFGTGVGEVSTLGELATVLSSVTGGTATLGPGGNISIVANGTNQIQIGGTANALTFGLHTTLAYPTDQVVVGDDLTTFIQQSVGGGAITTYDVSGSPVDVQFRWAKVDSTTLGTGHNDTWNLFYQVNSNAAGDEAAWRNVGTNFTFDSNGQMNPSVAGLTLPNVTIDGVSLGTLALNFGAGGITQFSDPNGGAEVNLLTQNGYAAGSLQTVSVNEKGRLVGSYSNGRSLDLAEITLATFAGANYLKRLDGGAFEATDQSGDALYNSSATVLASSLEGSNTDIADEFTKLIVTQQAYSANTRVISTSNQMVQDLLNMLR